MSETIRLGILGCGRIVQEGILPGARAAKSHITVSAIASLRAGVAEETAKVHGVSHFYTNYEDLLLNPEVDAVYIPVTGEGHHRWTIAAAQAGKHVLCEKSLATSVREAEEMVSACEQANVILHEAFMWRHHPRSLKTRELLRTGAIGELRLVNVNFSFDIDRSDWRMSLEKGGGAIWDVGCYGVNASRFFSGEEPEDIHARARFHETGIEMTMQIALCFPGNVMANIDCSFEAPFRCHVELVGNAGRIILPFTFLPEDDAPLWIYRTCERDDPHEIITSPGFNQYGCELINFCESIQAGVLQDPAENGLNNMKVLESALQCARNASQ